MVSMKILRDYSFNTIVEYYEYILQSITNGQRKQAIALVQILSSKQKKQAIEYLEVYTSNQADECKKLILATL